MKADLSTFPDAKNYHSCKGWYDDVSKWKEDFEASLRSRWEESKKLADEWHDRGHPEIGFQHDGQILLIKEILGDES